ncbi:uncharacterized protein si:dkey-229b18.3 [Electrophorus electricus]|uniref:uncharacterized protein si:dkey-229b18.3 n=1 Tax=Electrophorus electricus TaxID=8005 RepID=UPI0015CFB809|nr:uncharacterized protein si:dkey-229b18.3 [Electrophorus electricus]XP_026851576.2 uncharacterized protein si:dkey-229b18.3 [Electrophorus electricus]
MAGECTYTAHYASDDTFCTAKHSVDQQPELGYLNGVGTAKTCPTVASSPFFEMIGGSLFRKKLEKGCLQYREVLADDERLKSIEVFHAKIPGKSHHTLEDTYRLVAEHYWWEGMYFQVRDFVLGCEECHLRQTEKACSEVGNVSRMVKSHGRGVLSKLNSQRVAGQFCDITLKTGNGHLFLAHKAVLAAVSEYFQELFTEMDSATNPQPHVDLTGFSEESLLALLEFSYTSTLTLNLDTLTEVAAMARHLRMWPALEACSAIQKEKEADEQFSDPLNPAGALTVKPGSSSMNSRRSQHSPAGRTVGFKNTTEKDEGEALGSVWSSPMQCRAHAVEGTDESDGEVCDRTLPAQCRTQALHSPQPEDSGFSCSPTRRMKLMDFKSPSSKRKLCPRPSSVVISTSPSTSTRSSSPSRRLLRSTPGAALALRRLLPKIDLSSKSKRRSSYPPQFYRAKSDFSPVQSRAQPNPVTPLKVKQEMVEEEVCSAVLQDEVHCPRAQEKYRLLTFLGLQRKSLLPSPEELSGWGQKKRLRKLKVNDYSLTARRKPRTQALGRCGTGLGDLVGVSSSLSLCDMTRMDLLKKVMKVEPQEPKVTMAKSSKRKNDASGHMEHSSVRATRSHSLLQADSKGLKTERPLRSNTRGPNKPIPQPAGRERVAVQRAHAPPKRARTVRTKREPNLAISQPIPYPGGAHHYQGLTVAPPKVRAPKDVTSVDRPLRISGTKSKRKLCYNVGRTTDKHKGSRQNKSDKGKHGCNDKTVRLPLQQSGVGRGDQVRQSRKSMAQRDGTGEKTEVLHSARSWDASSTNYQDYHTNPLYRAIKEEPADPIPLTQAFPASDASDLGKRQSKPPVKLLDQGFLFGLCRPPGGIKREEESVDICLTRSVSHSSASRSDTSPGLVRRDRISARILPDRTGLDGPHWAGVGNRSTLFSQRMLLRVKKEEEETCVSQRPKAIRSSAQHKDSKRTCKVKRELPKAKVKKLYPMSSRHTVMLESIQRAQVKQLKGPCGQGSGGAHTCLQCRSSYRDCDALIMHRIRHIEGKHWPCPLCSKTFFRQKNVRNHIRTHNPKLYKCRHCVASS